MIANMCGGTCWPIGNWSLVRISTDYYTDIQHLLHKLVLDTENTCAAFIHNLSQELAQVVGPQHPENVQKKAFQIAFLHRDLGRNSGLHRESGRTTVRSKLQLKQNQI